MSIADLLPQQDTARSTRGRVPLTRVQINGTAVDVTPTQATLAFADGAHDQAQIGFTSDTILDTDNMVDKPISFVWGAAPHSEFFYGYITQVDQAGSSGAQTALTFTLTCLGATKAMFEGTPRFWTNASIPNVVRDLSYLNLLGYVGHDQTYSWKGLAQTSESDWQIANRFAKRLGWLLFNRYGVVQCYDPVRLFSESGTYVRLVQGSGFQPGVDRNLLDFKPNEEAQVLNQNLGAEYGYFTSSNAVQVVRQAGNYKGWVFNTEVVVDDQDVASIYTNAANVSIDRWQQAAMARVWGDADIYPGMCVEVVTTNPQYMRTKYDGKWLVRGTQHQMDRQSYQTLLYLFRPDSKTGVGVKPYTPFWREGAENYSRPRPGLSILEGSWVSSWTSRSARSLV